MKKNNAVIYFGLGIAAFALGIVVSGPLYRLVHQDRPFGGPPGGDGDRQILWLLEKELDLTSEQSQKIKNIVDGNMKREHQYREIIRRTLDKNIPIIEEGEKFDENRARALIRSLDHVDEEIKVMFMKQLHDISAVLTPEQREKFREMRNKGMGLFPGGRGPRGHGHGDGPPGPPPGQPPLMP